MILASVEYQFIEQQVLILGTPSIFGLLLMHQWLSKNFPAQSIACMVRNVIHYFAKSY